MPSVDENRHAPATANNASISPGAVPLKVHWRFSRIASDHPGTPGGGAAVLAKVDVDVNLAI
mgnify:CR=1